MKDFAQRLDKLRREGESKKDFALRIGVNPIQLSRYYAGIAPGREVLTRIAEHTGASLDWLHYGLEAGSWERLPARRLGAMTKHALDDHDLVNLACSYLDEIKTLDKERREALKQLLWHAVQNPASLDKLVTYFGFIKFEEDKKRKK